MRIKLDKADTAFSLYIRLRDGRCCRCGRVGSPDALGRTIGGLQASHYFGRANEATRFDGDNVDALCFGCHQEWGSRDRESYRDFKIKQLGQKGFDDLKIQARMIVKKDRKMALLYAKELLKTLNK